MTVAYGFTKAQVQRLVQQRLKAKEIASILGCSRPTLFAYLQRYKLSLQAEAKTYWPQPDDIFGLWTVLEQAAGNPKLIHYRCRCACGTVRLVSKYNLINSKSKSCGCEKYRRGSDNTAFTGYEEISGKFWARIRHHARARSLPFSLKLPDVWQLFIEQKRRCALSGLPLKFGKNCSASLDRIDSTKGYTHRNVQWVHKDINRMKQHYAQDYFLSLCRHVASRNA